jgi:hypothetical protein
VQIDNHRPTTAVERNGLRPLLLRVVRHLPVRSD